AHAVDLPTSPQNKNAPAGANVNSKPATAAANPKNQNKNAASAGNSAPAKLAIDAKKAEAAKVEAFKTETVKAEAVKTEIAEPKPAAAKTETAKTETAKTETIKTEAAKTNNAPLAVPVGGIQSQSAEIKNAETVKKPETANAAKPNNESKPAAGKEQPKPVRIEPPKNTSPGVQSQNWVIQAGAFSMESSAAQIRDKIAPLGYDVKIVKAGTDKPLYKVMVSPGNSRAAPNDALKKINSIGIEGYIIGGRP
ncbi:MAG: SPOR domain-containing protein, partial [Synergistaceae bacterium]|nr:SPOR domain-containing protein [Synergistaceae bacterium]